MSPFRVALGQSAASGTTDFDGSSCIACSNTGQGTGLVRGRGDCRSVCRSLLSLPASHQRPARLCLVSHPCRPSAMAHVDVYVRSSAIFRVFKRANLCIIHRSPPFGFQFLPNLRHNTFHFANPTTTIHPVLKSIPASASFVPDLCLTFKYEPFWRFLPLDDF